MRLIAAVVLLLALAHPAGAADERVRFSHSYDACTLNNGRGVAILLGVIGPDESGAGGTEPQFQVSFGTAEFVNLEGVPSRSTFATAAHNFFQDGKALVVGRPDFEAAYLVLLPQWTREGCRIVAYHIAPGSVIALTDDPIREVRDDQALFEIDGKVPGTITPSLIPAGDSDPCGGRELEQIAFFSDLIELGGTLDRERLEALSTGLARQTCRAGRQRQMTAMYRSFGRGVEAFDCITTHGASGSLLTCLGPEGRRWAHSIVTGWAQFETGRASTGSYSQYNAAVVPSRELKSRYLARHGGGASD